ncbi:MAG: tRNA dihydrouridine synthase [Eubacterium sp.]|jgi:tRNA-dihydrouridine synthase
MKYYAAPLEGITGYPFRNAVQKFFPGADRYFSPFLVANQTLTFKKKEQRDVAPANNRTLTLIPQILTNRPEQLVWAAEQLYDLGYPEINLNLGCPSGTVTARHKGSGMLEDPDGLDRFFAQVFELLRQKKEKEGKSPVLSVKTRIGVREPAEADRLIAVYNRYPLAEVTVHPRVQKEMYQGKPHLEIFARFYADCVHPLVYNGDVNTVADCRQIEAQFPAVRAVMIGRGMVADPAVFRRLRGGEPMKPEELKQFLDCLMNDYAAEMSGDLQVMCKMKEIWGYLGSRFPDSGKYIRKIRKARTIAEYEGALGDLFLHCRMLA